MHNTHTPLTQTIQQTLANETYTHLQEKHWVLNILNHPTIINENGTPTIHLRIITHFHKIQFHPTAATTQTKQQNQNEWQTTNTLPYENPNFHKQLHKHIQQIIHPKSTNK